jgi:sialate O-acetylesterase
MFDGMVAPWTGVPRAGALWYQGETNAGRAEQYATLLPELVRDWRRAWKDPGFAFLVVQLTAYDPTAYQGAAGEWPELREAQLAVLDLPKTAVVTTLDVGERTNIHPARKKPVGERLARAALKVAYGREGTLPPLYGSMRVEGSKVRVALKGAEKGLVAEGGKPKGFQVAGRDGVFVPAEARIEGSEVVVWSKAVDGPAHVRYAWADWPECNLFSKDGWPVAPFRTDKLPLLTKGRR